MNERVCACVLESHLHILDRQFTYKIRARNPHDLERECVYVCVWGGGIDVFEEGGGTFRTAVN